MKAIEPFMETLLIILHNVMHSPCAPGLFPREGPCIGMRPPIQEYYTIIIHLRIHFMLNIAN